MTKQEKLNRQAEDDEFGIEATSVDADVRDREAEARDIAAELRDVNATLRDASAGSSQAEIDLKLLAAADRAEAALDRLRAAKNRVDSALDRSLSSFDELTGAYRRTPGMTEARRELARARRLGQGLTLVFVDVDRLKTLNDSQGHAAGDHLLTSVVREIRHVLRSYDITLRYGGDEFVCVLSNVDVAEAHARFDHVNVVLASRLVPGSISVGVAEAQADETVEDLVARADEIMFLGRESRHGPHR